MVLNVLFMKIYKVKVMQNDSNFVIMHSNCMFITMLIKVHWRIIKHNIKIQSTKNLSWNYLHARQHLTTKCALTYSMSTSNKICKDEKREQTRVYVIQYPCKIVKHKDILVLKYWVKPFFVYNWSYRAKIHHL